MSSPKLYLSAASQLVVSATYLSFTDKAKKSAPSKKVSLVEW